MKITYSIGHRPVDRTTGDDSIIFYGANMETTYRAAKMSCPIGPGNMVKIDGDVYAIIDMRLEKADHARLWLYPLDQYRAEKAAGKFLK